MAHTPSFSIDVSPKDTVLPTENSIEEEAKKTRRAKQVMKYSEKMAPTILQKIVAEFLGTYILIFAGCASALVNNIQPLGVVGIALVWGLVLMSAIYALGHISGAHFNPAVTVAFATTRKLPWMHVPLYILSQLVGSTFASLTLKGLFNARFSISPIATQFSSPTTDLEAIIWEFIISFTLMFVISAVATDSRATKELSGAAIGATLMFNAIIAGPITGASMNPARSIGPAIVSGKFKGLWVYIIAPILGTTLAATVYCFLQPAKENQLEKDDDMNNDVYSHSES